MTTIDKKSKLPEKDEKLEENSFFDLNQDLTLTSEEVKRLKNSLEKTEVDPRTREFFKSARDLYEKLKKNNYTISLEELIQN